jgi:hypothetical protein
MAKALPSRYEGLDLGDPISKPVLRKLDRTLARFANHASAEVLTVVNRIPNEEGVADEEAESAQLGQDLITGKKYLKPAASPIANGPKIPERVEIAYYSPEGREIETASTSSSFRHIDMDESSTRAIGHISFLKENEGSIFTGVIVPYSDGVLLVHADVRLPAYVATEEAGEGRKSQPSDDEREFTHFAGSLGLRELISGAPVERPMHADYDFYADDRIGRAVVKGLSDLAVANGIND